MRRLPIICLLFLSTIAALALSSALVIARPLGSHRTQHVHRRLEKSAKHAAARRATVRRAAVRKATRSLGGPARGKLSATALLNGAAAQAADPVLLGNQSVAGTKDGGSGTSEAFGYTATVTGTATNVNVYLDSTDGVALGLYADKSQKPGARLDHASVASNSAGWVTLPLSAAVQITSGTRYWIAIAATSSRRTIGYRDAGSSGSTLDYSGSGLANPYGIQQQWNSNPASAYVGGTASTPPPPPPAAPTNTVRPVVSGTASQGQTVSASSGSWTGSPTSYAYQWQDGGTTNIAGATSASYTASAADVGHTLDVVVTATNAGGSASASSAATAIVVAPPPPSAPSNTVLPLVTGTASQGRTVSASSGSWTGSPTSYAYKWEDCSSSGASCTSVSGATSNSYVLASGDVGHTMRGVVTATNGGGSTVATAVQTAVVTNSSQACTTTIGAQSMATVISNAAAGSTVCLNSGSYSGGTVNSAKSSMTTFVAGAGQSPVIGALTFSAASNITLQNVSINGGSVGNGYSSPSTTSTHIHFVGDTFTGGLCIDTASSVNQDTLVDSSTFTNVGQSCEEGRISIIGQSNVNNGVVISNNIIGNPNGTDTGASDGIDPDGGSVGVMILHNQFLNINQSACGSVHCDSIQPYGGTGWTASGNYFRGDSTCLGDYDGNGSPFTWTNNVMDETNEYSGGPIYDSGGRGDTITHNTVISSPAASLTLSGSNDGQSTGAIVENNILLGGISGAGSNTIDYNLIPGGGGGTHGLNGTPTFVGGSHPSTWAGWQLASGSLGTGAASDGLNMGATSFGP
jgi:hypothetical protein